MTTEQFQDLKRKMKKETPHVSQRLVSELSIQSHTQKKKYLVKIHGHDGTHDEKDP